jgi:hypothetical protein
MPSPTPKQLLQQWFQYLQAMQTAAESASQVPGTLTLSVFANTTITAVLTDSLSQCTFIVALNGQTPFSFNEALLLQSSTFESLLEKASTSAPILLFANFLESCVRPPYSTMSLEDLSASLLSDLFPVGKGDDAWTTFQNGLTSSIPASCYSSAQQTATTNLLAKTSSTVGNLLTQLIKLG